MELTKEQKSKFDILNGVWQIVKPYVGDKEPEYKKVLSDCFKIFFKNRGDAYSDEWKDSLCKELIDYPDCYKDRQDICGFAAELVMGFNRFISMNTHSDYDFYCCIGDVFLGERERLINGMQ